MFPLQLWELLVAQVSESKLPCLDLLLSLSLDNAASVIIKQVSIWAIRWPCAHSKIYTYCHVR